jgi:hypothetical protein
VREHVGLGERPAGRAEARAQLVEERKVDVDVLVDRAVERPTSEVAVPQPVSVEPSKKTVLTIA